ncbi:MAG: RluA family pseudouridine synthase [Clostridia bacterium]|nr:RluA family pseudouridine synthase [Clostridia bacterium]
MEKLEYYIEKEEFIGIRIDKALSELNTDISRAMVQRLIYEGKVHVNGKAIKASYKLQRGDRISVEIDAPKEVDLVAQDIPLDIVYEDDDILVINKQKGLVVHPGNGNPDGTLVNAILNYCKDSLSGIGGEIRPGIVHRIDKDTSGLLIVAKNDKSHVNLSEQIKNHEVKKTYIALVRGNTKENQATIDMPIARSTKDRTKMAVSKNGKNAVTHFKVLERFNGYTLLEVNIETGRTHQIRVHLAQIGYPIVGDNVYSNGKNPFGVEGQMLHSYKLRFKHPISGKDMELEAPLPKYFNEVLSNIRPQKE